MFVSPVLFLENSNILLLPHRHNEEEIGLQFGWRSIRALKQSINLFPKHRSDGQTSFFDHHVVFIVESVERNIYTVYICVIGSQRAIIYIKSQISLCGEWNWIHMKYTKEIKIKTETEKQSYAWNSSTYEFGIKWMIE